MMEAAYIGMGQGFLAEPLTVTSWWWVGRTRLPITKKHFMLLDTSALSHLALLPLVVHQPHENTTSQRDGAVRSQWEQF